MRPEYEALLHELKGDFAPGAADRLKEQQEQCLETTTRRLEDELKQIINLRPQKNKHIRYLVLSRHNAIIRQVKQVCSQRTIKRIDRMMSTARFVTLHLLAILYSMDKIATLRDYTDKPDAIDIMKDSQYQQIEQMELLKTLLECAVDVLRDSEFISLKTKKLLTLFGLLLEIGKRLPIYHAMLGDKAAKTSLDDNEMLSPGRLQDILHRQKASTYRVTRGKDASSKLKSMVRRKARTLKAAHPTWRRNKVATELMKDPDIAAAGYSPQAISDWIGEIFPTKTRA